MNKLFWGAVVICGALAATVAMRAVMTMTSEKIVIKDQSPSGFLHRLIPEGKSIEEIRRIAKAEAARAVERAARRKQREASEAARKFAAEQKRLLAEARKKWALEWKSLNPEERQMLDELNEVMCEEDLETVSLAAEEFAKHPNPVVRRAVVEAISWFGDKGLPDLAVFLVDEDEEVSSLAKERWSLGVQEVEDEQEKVALAKLGMLYVKDEDSLTTFMGDLSSVDDDLKIMQALVDLIEEGPQEAAAVACEQYEWMTGDEWTNFDAAEAWLQENYEPPEPEEGEEVEEEAMEADVGE